MHHHLDPSNRKEEFLFAQQQSSQWETAAILDSATALHNCLFFLLEKQVRGMREGDRDGEYMCIHGWFMSMYDKTHYNIVK